MIISLSGNNYTEGLGLELYLFNFHFFFFISLEVYGAKITTLRADVGSRPSTEALKEALGQKKYKMVTVTHVDTS